MAEEEEAGAEGAPAPVKKSGGKKMIVMGLVASIVLGGGGVGAYVVLNKPKTPDHAEESDRNPKDPKTKVMTLPSVTVNLRSSLGTRYVKVTVAVETASEDALKEMGDTKKPHITDFLIETFSGLDIKELDTGGPRGNLKNKIMKGINTFLEKGSIVKVYFTEFIIQ